MTGRVRAFVATLLGSVALVASGGSSWAEVPSGEVSWVSTGDSYSSGEGVSGNRGPCVQSDLAYGPLAARSARDAGWNITAEAFTACTGHLVEDLFNQRPGTENKDLWAWGLEQGAPDRVDLLTFSFGGNDIGFADLLIDCLPLPDSFTNAVTGIVRNDSLDLTGCDTPEPEVEARIAALLDPPRRGCEGGRQADRRQGGPGYDCDLLIDDRGSQDPGDDLRGTLVDFYVHLADEHLTDRGHIVVAGYPNMFAPVGEWPGWVKLQCQGIGRGDTERLGRLAADLDAALAQAVRQANDQLGRERIQYLPRSLVFRDGSHELCGTGEDWLNGVSIRRGDGTPRIETSFHPNAAGHDATAEALIRLLEPISFEVATLGVVWASSQEGYGEIEPTRIFNGGDPTGLVTDVRWDSWGEDTATGRGISVWEGAAATVADAPQSEAVVTAFDLGDCNGQLAYRAINWYFPEYGQSFDPESYINICTGDYVFPEPEPVTTTSDPEAVGRAFIDAWRNGDTATMQALSDPTSFSGLLANTQRLRPNGPADSCYSIGSQYQCNATGEGGEALYVLKNPVGSSWLVSWAAQSAGD